MPEAALMRKIQVAVSGVGARVFRNNVAVAWAANKPFIPKEPCVCTVYPGDVVLRQARPIHAGLCDGSSDLIGWNSVLITEAMVGRTVAVFTALEIKTEKGRVSESQKNFISAVNSSGGIAGVARSESDAVKHINDFKI
jgi:hypothetical protein